MNTIDWLEKYDDENGTSWSESNDEIAIAMEKYAIEYMNERLNEASIKNRIVSEHRKHAGWSEGDEWARIAAIKIISTILLQ